MADRMTALSMLAHLIDHVMETGEHVYVGGDGAEVCFHEGFGLYPLGTTCSGNTIILPNSGRLTIGSDPKDVPDGSVISFLGVTGDEISKWRNKAKKILTFAEASFTGARAS